MAKRGKKNGLSRAEIQRRYRERKKQENPERFLAKERARWLKRRAEKKVKVIADCTEREKRAIRHDWRQRSLRSKLRYQNAQAALPDSPPESITSTQLSRGRKKKETTKLKELPHDS